MPSLEMLKAVLEGATEWGGINEPSHRRSDGPASGHESNAPLRHIAEEGRRIDAKDLFDRQTLPECRSVAQLLRPGCPGYEARNAALIAPADTPVMMGKLTFGMLCAIQRRNPT